jgi:glycosyltransferase involved in cell wall biosynthesis
MERAAIGYADAAFTVTEELKALEVSRGANAEKIHVVLNGPQGANLLHARRPNVRPDPDRFTLIIHGTIEDRYGHDTLLEAIDIARREVPELRLRIAGTGTNLPRVQQMIVDLGLEDTVEYLGWLSLEDLVDELSAADVGVIAMKASPYSHVVHTNKMYEYILFDLPILASRLRSVSEYFDDSCIQYFTPGDPDSMAAGIVGLRNDAARRRALVRNARSLYDAQYDWDIQKEILLDVTDRVLEQDS